MRVDPEVSAAAANDAYKDRPASDIDNQKRPIYLKGHEYVVFGYASDLTTGFHGTAYRSKDTGEVLIAIRGTDPDWKNHARTTVQDALTDFAMVKEQANNQKAAADEFTRAMIEKSQALGISKDNIFLAGHSLGGTLVEIEAWEFGLNGASFNAYGAAELIHGVPPGGKQVTNYVMAGDVVSAGSHHFGEVRVLASLEDVAALKAGRYLDAPLGALPPNPLVAMRLGDHSVTHFTGEGGMANMLTLAKLAAGEARYLQYKPAIDRAREELRHDRVELGDALRNPDSRTISTTLAHLSPRLQQQLAEVHALAIDAPIHRMIEQNSLMQGGERAFDYTSSALRANGERAQQKADQFSDAVRGAGRTVQEKADGIARTSLGYSAINPLAAAGVALGATVTGYAARAQAEGLAQASHIAGRVTQATGQFGADQIQLAKHFAQTGAHGAAAVATAVVHTNERYLVGVVDTALRAAPGARAVGDAASRAYGVTRDALSQGVGATIQAAETTYGALSHPGHWFGQTPVPVPPSATTAHMPAKPGQPVGISDSTHALNDPRHPGNRDHGLYNELHRRIPDASEKRLLQFTDACHSSRISVTNLGEIHLDEKRGQIVFATSWPPQAPAVVDLKHPSPDPQQSINHIQQHDLQQARTAQANQQGQAQGAPQAPCR